MTSGLRCFHEFLSRVPSAADVSAAVIPPTQRDSQQNEDGAVGPIVSESVPS